MFSIDGELYVLGAASRHLQCNVATLAKHHDAWGIRTRVVPNRRGKLYRLDNVQRLAAGSSTAPTGASSGKATPRRTRNKVRA